MTSQRKVSIPIPRNQRGAVLFVSLMLLIVLSLIGIASMQVTTLQEHMAGNYYLQNKAFEYGEWMVRQQENTIQTAVSAGSTFHSNDDACAGTYNGFGSVDAWAAAKTPTAVGGTLPGNMVPGSWYTRRIDTCGPGLGARNSGQTINNSTTATFQVIGADNDAPTVGGVVNNANASTLGVVVTVYVP
jgi:type IV pilus assembly protein PilX